MAVRAAWRDDINVQLQGHRSDALAILLGVAGVIAALGIYSDLAGPLGRAIDHGSAAVLGGGRFLVPVALIIGALALIIPVRVDEDEEEDEVVERAGRGWRLGIGLALTLLAAVGLMHVGHGNPPRSIDALERAGGVVGALVGAPLRAGLGPAGAVIVLIAIGALGLLLMVGTGLRQVGQGVTLAARFVGRQARALLAMPTIATETESEAVDLVAAELADDRHDAGEEESVVAELDEEDELEDEEEEEYEEESEEEGEDEEYEDEEYEDDGPEEEEEDEDEEEEDDDAAAVSVEGEQLSIHLPPGHRLSPWKLPPRTS